MGSLSPSTIAAASFGVLATSALAYLVYFDHRRQTDPEFRRALRRDAKKQARAAKDEADAAGSALRRRVKEAVDAANANEFPTQPEERERFFMKEITEGEVTAQTGMDHVALRALLIAQDPFEAALCFYRGLKVYPSPSALLPSLDKMLPKVCDWLVDVPC